MKKKVNICVLTPRMMKIAIAIETMIMFLVGHHIKTCPLASKPDVILWCGALVDTESRTRKLDMEQNTFRHEVEPLRMPQQKEY